jgi:Protein of unknown function (DUF2793)
MSNTTHLGLPYLAAAQAQKHVTHNEALTRLDSLVQLAVKSRTLATPPATPVEGDRYLIAASPTGDWTGQVGKIAMRLDGQWQFVTPREGFAIWVNDEDATLWFNGSTWVAGSTPTELQNMALLGVNATADANAKFTVASVTTLFNHVGNGHQLKINKAASTDAASVLLQSGFSGRAEIGLVGDNDLRVKVSTNGTSFTEALTVAANDGTVLAHQALKLGGQTSEPATPVDGQIWYNQNLGKFRKRQAGVSTDMDTVGGGGGLSDGDYGDVTVSGGGTVLKVDSGSSAFALTGVITPPLLTTNQNNFAPAGLSTCSVLRLSSDNDSRIITGISGGSDGRILTLWNVGEQDIVLEKESSGSSALNRFSGGEADVVVAANDSVLLQYDAVRARWAIITATHAGQAFPEMRHRPFFNTDFLNNTSTANPPFTGAAISAGTSSIISTSIDGNHPGVIRMTSSTTANSGYRWQTDLAALRIGGSEYFEIIFCPRNFATSLCRFGFHDSSTNVDAVDGVYFETTTAGQLFGKTANNSVRSTSAAIATLALNTWYRARLIVNRDATAANFELYGANGVLLGTQSISTNIPTATGRETGVGVVGTNSGIVATSIVDIDYMAFACGARRPLAR